MIEATGRPPVLVPPERARYSREHVGSDYIGWLPYGLYIKPEELQGLSAYASCRSNIGIDIALANATFVCHQPLIKRN